MGGDTALIGASGDDDNGSQSGSAYVFSLIPDTVVTIYIKPSKKTADYVINLKKGKNLNVAILGSETFDALQVEPDSVKFGPKVVEASPVRSQGRARQLHKNQLVK